MEIVKESLARGRRWKRPTGSVDPSPMQYAAWGAYVDNGAAPDENGWWNGWCPLHDGKPSPVVLAYTAQFNFAAGAMLCLRETPCHEAPNGITLTNLQIKLAGRGAH